MKFPVRLAMNKTSEIKLNSNYGSCCLKEMILTWNTILRYLNADNSLLPNQDNREIS